MKGSILGTTLLALLVLVASASSAPLLLGQQEGLGECVVVYRQGEVYVCIPSLNRVSGDEVYISVSWVSRTRLVFTIAPLNTSKQVTVDIEVMDQDMRVLSTATAIVQGEPKSVEVPLPPNLDTVLYRCKVNGKELPVAGLKAPNPLEIPEATKGSTVVATALALVPVSLFLGYLLASDVRESAVICVASLFAAYTVLSFLVPDTMTPYLNMLFALALLFSIIYYVIGRVRV